MSTMTKQEALDKVAALSQKIDKGEMSLEQWKWQRAEAMADASDAGATVREIADAAGCGKSQVSAHISAWRSVRGTRTKPAFSDAYDAATGFDRDAAQERTDKARAKKWITNAPAEQVREMVAETTKDDPKKRLAVQMGTVDSAPPQEPKPAPADPTFISLVVLATGHIQNMRAMVDGWQGPQAVPAEFDLSTFAYLRNDLLRVEERIRELRSSPNLAEFQRIVADLDGVL